MDLKLIETGDGGDFVWLDSKSDFKMISGFENMPYLASFGGNVEQSTQEFQAGELRGDWWGNEVFNDQNSSVQMNSELERLLNTVVLSSSGRLLIEQAVKQDVEFMTEFAEVSVAVSLNGVDRIHIKININEPDNLESNVFVYIWDSTKNELIS